MASVDDAIEFLRQSSDAESENRQRGLEALQFRYGDQWPQYAIASRGLERPQLTINETNTYIKKVTNQQRQQRPRGRASPVDNYADPKIAKVITGLGRHVEVNSDADNAYDTAFDFAATIGWGYWRLRTDFIAEDSRQQDIFIDVIDNAFCVYFDPNSRLPDGSDADGALITDLMAKDTFQKMYPDASMNGFYDRGTGDSDPDWVSEHDIRIAEYYCIERQKKKLVYLSDGTDLWEDKMNAAVGAAMKQLGVTIVGSRESFRRQVKWCKQTAFDILEEKDIPGRFIPIVPVYWTNVIIDSRRVRQGLVKDAMDPQRMVNFWQTALTESLAMAPKPKWVMAEGQDEGHENEWKSANVSPMPVLRYKVTDVEGKPAPPPQRVAPEPPPTGFIEAAFLSSQNLSRVLGIFDPAVRGGAQHKSDQTLNAEQGQSEMTNFDGYDNLTRSIKHSWRIMLSWFPVVYDTQQVKRIIGDDGREELVTINERTQTQDETGQAIEKVLNDIRVGTYDVVMDTGPGYDTKRKEGVATMVEIMGTPIGEQVAHVGSDIMVRMMDFDGADKLADRLAASNPLAEIDEKSDVPPRAQMQLKSAQQMIQQLQQAIQQLELEKKFGLEKEDMRQKGETRRELMRQTGDAHEREITQAQKQHDTETYALSAQNVAEINALARILVSKTEHGHRLREMLEQFKHDAAMQDQQLAAKSEETETVQ